MITGDLDNQMKEIYYKITRLQNELDNLNSLVNSKNLTTPIEVIEEFIEHTKNIKIILSFSCSRFRSF